jgi:hypothetical protein
MDLDPEYQRGHVWTERQESKFVGALLEHNQAIPPFWMNWTGPNRQSSEVVDGKQRIKACLRWLNDEIPANCPCGIDVWYSELCEVDNRALDLYVTMSWNFVNLSPVDVMKFYLRLNGGGTIHTEDELERVKRLITLSEMER